MREHAAVQLDLASRPWWQIASGGEGRDYADSFVRLGVAAVGGGGRFAERLDQEVQPGDVVLLRHGQRTIRAIGVVAEERVSQQHREMFSDLQGYSLETIRRMHWHKYTQPVRLPPRALPRSRFSAIGRDSAARREATELLRHVSPTLIEQPLPPLEDPTPKLSDDEIPSELLELRHRAQDFEGKDNLIWDNGRFGQSPNEFEALTHFVVPLLCAIGWDLPRIAVEWKRIDVATFSRLPRQESNCHMVIEVKRVGLGLLVS